MFGALGPEVGRQDGAELRVPAEWNIGGGAFPSDDVIDQPIDPIAGDFGLAPMLQCDRLERFDQGGLTDLGAMLAHVGAGGLQQMLADMQLAGEPLAQRVAELVQPFGWPECGGIARVVFRRRFWEDVRDRDGIVLALP